MLILSIILVYLFLIIFNNFNYLTKKSFIKNKNKYNLIQLIFYFYKSNIIEIINGFIFFRFKKCRCTTHQFGGY